MGDLRLFVAVPATPEVTSVAAGMVEALRGAGDVRWVTPENLHLTLRFLGPTAPERLPELFEILDKSNNYSSFVVSLHGVGAFPSVSRPRTVWIGIRDEGGLARLAAAIEAAVTGLGWTPEGRPYHAHLTIGRVRSDKGRAELARRLAALPRRPAQPWPVEGFQLMQSDPTASGSRYTVLREFELNGERQRKQSA